MDRTTDYIAWLGDIDFTVRPFGDVDAVILCTLAYYDFGPVMQEASGKRGGFYLRDAVPGIESGKVGIRITGGEQGAGELLKAAALSKRFGELKLSDLADEFDPEQSLQFAAVTFSYKKDFSLVAFRGTDNSLVGWKEDFMAAYTETQAQKLAGQYAERVFRKYRKGILSPADHRKWYIGGHSKGANLAAFAACRLPDEVLKKVEKVYVLDGPGFSPDVVPPETIERIYGKTVRIIPEYSIIGRLMEVPYPDTRIIQSFNDGAMQHSITSWGVYHGGLAMSDLKEPKDRWINETLKEWIEGMPPGNRRVLVDDLFDALGAGGANTIEDIAGGGKDGIEAILKSLAEINGTTKDAISQLSSAALENIKKQITGIFKREKDVEKQGKGEGKR